jgi:NAD-dependent dihydropyrimidine dehydrogenase PreA subunit
MDILRPALLAVALVACAPSLAGFGEIPDAPTSETPDAAGGDAAPAEAAVRPDTADASDGAATPDAAPVADAAVEAATPDASEAAADVAAEVAAADARLRPCSVATECGTLRPGWVPSCQRGECVDVCPMSYADCDGSAVNACETRITSRLNCGACGRVCPTSCIVRPGGVYECT